ncbi:MAG: hypothetical protein QNJ55_02975 [Xenococcus sp. MO_188.B8]|nr:hypothetical protein [Xenococcus sp. MO_188.B8]
MSILALAIINPMSKIEKEREVWGMLQGLPKRKSPNLIDNLSSFLVIANQKSDRDSNVS